MNVCGTVDTKSITNSRVPVRSLEYKMDDLTGFQRDLLYVIAGADQPSGQDVKSEVETYYNSEINHGRLYPNLDTLVNKDLVEKGSSIDELTTTRSVIAADKRSSSAGSGNNSISTAGPTPTSPALSTPIAERHVPTG